MIMKVNIGTDESPDWIGIDAENAHKLGGMTLNEILLLAKTQSTSLIYDATNEARKEITRTIESYKLDMVRILDEVDAELDKKVDKVPGKGLSTNDYTDVDKAIVDSIADFRAYFESFKKTLTSNVIANIFTDDFTSLDKWEIHEGYYNKPMHRIEAEKEA